MRTPQVLDPPTGWIQNTNNWPFSAAGPYSPRQADYPRYMDTFGETPRGLQAVRLLKNTPPLTLEGLRALAFDDYQTAFARLIPGLVSAWDRTAASNPLKRRLEPEIEALRRWDYRWSAGSVPTTLAMFWGEHLWAEVKRDGQAP